MFLVKSSLSLSFSVLKTTRKENFSLHHSHHVHQLNDDIILLVYRAGHCPDPSCEDGELKAFQINLTKIDDR